MFTHTLQAISKALTKAGISNHTDTHSDTIRIKHSKANHLSLSINKNTFKFTDWTVLARHQWPHTTYYQLADPNSINNLIKQIKQRLIELTP